MPSACWVTRSLSSSASAAATEGVAWFDEAILADEAASMAQAARAGGTMVAAQDRPAWQEGARKVWASFAPQLGGMAAIEAIAAG